jgi:hypothetical protein
VRCWTDETERRKTMSITEMILPPDTMPPRSTQVP